MQAIPVSTAHKKRTSGTIHFTGILMNSEVIIVLLIGIGIVAAIWFFARRKNKPASPIEQEGSALKRQLSRMRFQTKTPLGMKVKSEGPIEQETLNNYDLAYDLYVDQALRYYGANAITRPATSFTIYEMPSQKSPILKVDSFKVYLEKSDPYYTSPDSHEDQYGRYIWAAERVLPELNFEVLLVAETNDKYYEIDALYHGFEHMLLWDVDRNRYQQTIGPEHTHPILAR